MVGHRGSGAGEVIFGCAYVALPRRGLVTTLRDILFKKKCNFGQTFRGLD